MTKLTSAYGIKTLENLIYCIKKEEVKRIKNDGLAVNLPLFSARQAVIPDYGCCFLTDEGNWFYSANGVLSALLRFYMDGQPLDLTADTLVDTKLEDCLKPGVTLSGRYSYKDLEQSVNRQILNTLVCVDVIRLQAKEEDEILNQYYMSRVF